MVLLKLSFYDDKNILAFATFCKIEMGFLRDLEQDYLQSVRLFYSQFF